MNNCSAHRGQQTWERFSGRPFASATTTANQTPASARQTCSNRQILLRPADQSSRYLLFGLWIDRLIEINPQHTRKKCQHWGERQEKEDRPDCDIVQPPTGQNPEDHPKSKDEGEGQPVTDVHGAEKISWLAVEVETAGGAAIMHLGEAPVNGRAEDSAGPASPESSTTPTPAETPCTTLDAASHGKGG